MYDAFCLLYIAICDHPQGLSPTLMFTDYSYPAIAGTNATFSCTIASDGTLSAINIVVTCMDNRKLEPDPRKLCIITGIISFTTQ